MRLHEHYESSLGSGQLRVYNVPFYDYSIRPSDGKESDSLQAKNSNCLHHDAWPTIVIEADCSESHAQLNFDAW